MAKLNPEKGLFYALAVCPYQQTIYCLIFVFITDTNEDIVKEKKQKQWFQKKIPNKTWLIEEILSKKAVSYQNDLFNDSTKVLKVFLV